MANGRFVDAIDVFNTLYYHMIRFQTAKRVSHIKACRLFGLATAILYFVIQFMRSAISCMRSVKMRQHPDLKDAPRAVEFTFGLGDGEFPTLGSRTTLEDRMTHGPRWERMVGFPRECWKNSTTDG